MVEYFAIKNFPRHLYKFLLLPGTTIGLGGLSLEVRGQWGTLVVPGGTRPKKIGWGRAKTIFPGATRAIAMLGDIPSPLQGEVRVSNPLGSMWARGHLREV